MDSRDQKKIVRAFFKLVAQGKQKDSLSLFAADCKQHNPYVRGGMDALFDSMAEVQRQSKYLDAHLAVKSILADGDMVAVHTEFLGSGSKPEEGGLRKVHLFRFGKDNKIAEYWDITQQIMPNMPNAANAF